MRTLFIAGDGMSPWSLVKPLELYRLIAVGLPPDGLVFRKFHKQSWGAPRPKFRRFAHHFCPSKRSPCLFLALYFSLGTAPRIPCYLLLSNPWKKWLISSFRPVRLKWVYHGWTSPWCCIHLVRTPVRWHPSNAHIAIDTGSTGEITQAMSPQTLLWSECWSSAIKVSIRPCLRACNSLLHVCDYRCLHHQKRLIKACALINFYHERLAANPSSPSVPSL